MQKLNFISQSAGNNFEIKIKGGMQALCWQDGEDVKKEKKKKLKFHENMESKSH